MGGFEFEEFIAKLFDAKGYSARVTNSSGDQGADVVAEKDFEKLTIQAKRYKGKVSNSAVQEVVASMRHYEADRGLVITNSKFTSSAKELASSNGIELWNGRKLEKEIGKYMTGEKISNESSKPSTSTNKSYSDLKDGYRLVEFVDDCPEFMGTDLEKYSPYEEGETAKIPKENAKVIETDGNANIIR